MCDPTFDCQPLAQLAPPPPLAAGDCPAESCTPVPTASPDGRVLLSDNTRRAGIRCLPPGETQERELGWHDYSLATDLSADGSTLLFGEGGAWSAGASIAAGASRSVYLRTTDGAPAVRQLLPLVPDPGWPHPADRLARE